MFDYIDAFLILAILVNTILLTILLFKAAKNTSNNIFTVFVISIIAWSVCMVLFRTASDVSQSLFYGKLLYLSAAVIPYFFFIFCYSLNKDTNKKHIKLTYFSSITLIFLGLLCLWGDKIIKNIQIPENLTAIVSEKIFIWGDLYYLYILYQNIFFTLGFILLYKNYRRSSGLLRTQIQYISIGTLSAVSISFITNLFLPSFQIFNLNWVGQITTVLWAGFITVSIIRHRLFSVTNVINTIISIILNTAILYFFYYALSIFYIQLFGTLFSIPVYVVGIFIATLVSLFVNYLFNKTNDTKFVKNKYDPDKYLNILRQQNYINTTSQNILNDFIEITKSYLGIKRIEILSDNVINDPKYISIFNNIKSLDQKTFYKDEEKPVFQNKLFEDTVILLKIMKEKELLFLILIYERINYADYSIEDIQAIKEATERLNLSISTNILSEEQHMFNETLQKKLDTATAELQQQKAAVEDQYRTERDMVGIMGHELRTPLTSARGFLEIAVTKAKNDPEMPVKNIQHYLDNVFEAFKREIDLVQTMLSTSHVDNNKLKLDLIEVDLDGVIQGAVMDFTPEAEKKNLELEYHPIENLPHIKSDPSRTIEVINNLVSNAIKYTPAGRVDILLTYDDQFVYYSVKDTGEGIPESELPNIGKKFYRVQNYIEGSNKDATDKSIVRPGGTGLGMYIVKAILEAAGGELRIESKVGIGSTFTAVFPRWNE